jgi:type II secretory pathway component PulF
VSCITNNYTNKGGMQNETNRAQDEKEASQQLIKNYPGIFDINNNRKSKYTELKMKKEYQKIKL